MAGGGWRVARIVARTLGTRYSLLVTLYARIVVLRQVYKWPNHGTLPAPLPAQAARNARAHDRAIDETDHIIVAGPISQPAPTAVSPRANTFPAVVLLSLPTMHIGIDIGIRGVDHC